MVGISWRPRVPRSSPVTAWSGGEPLRPAASLHALLSLFVRLADPLAARDVVFPISFHGSLRVSAVPSGLQGWVLEMLGSASAHVHRDPWSRCSSRRRASDGNPAAVIEPIREETVAGECARQPGSSALEPGAAGACTREVVVMLNDGVRGKEGWSMRRSRQEPRWRKVPRVSAAWRCARTQVVLLVRLCRRGCLI